MSFALAVVSIVSFCCQAVRRLSAPSVSQLAGACWARKADDAAAQQIRNAAALSTRLVFMARIPSPTDGWLPALAGRMRAAPEYGANSAAATSFRLKAEAAR